MSRRIHAFLSFYFTTHRLATWWLCFSDLVVFERSHLSMKSQWVDVSGWLFSNFSLPFPVPEACSTIAFLFTWEDGVMAFSILISWKGRDSLDIQNMAILY